MSRCECGSTLQYATVQPHPKSAPVPVAVCRASHVVPEQCAALTKVRVVGLPINRMTSAVKNYKVVVDELVLGVIWTVPYRAGDHVAERWAWALALDADRGEENERDDAVRAILRKTNE